MREEKIIQNMRARSPDALELLMNSYMPYVSTIVWNILRYSMTKEDAEEVVSDVFIAAWNQAEDLRAGHVKAWLGSVARNKAKDKLRQMNRDLPLEDDILEIPGDDIPASAAEKADERRLVQAAINQLSETDKEVFLRYYYYSQNVAEISRSMNMNESTVKTKLRRGRMRLKELLARWDVQ